VSSLTCREENGELVCERDIDIELRKLKESVIRELLERMISELEMEIDIPNIGKAKAILKRKEK
jgi:hypothetical protein